LVGLYKREIEEGEKKIPTACDNYFVLKEQEVKIVLFLDLVV